jgi:hypothetical protein
MPLPQVTEYDADQIVIIIAGIPISKGAGVSGYADGEFVAIKFPEGFTVVKGTDGFIARSKTNDFTAEATINLLQTNSANAALSALYAADRAQPNGAGIGSFVLKDLQGTTLVVAAASWITKPADITLDRGAKGRSWPLTLILASDPVVGGNAACVGAAGDLDSFYAGTDISVAGIHWETEVDHLLSHAY